MLLTNPPWPCLPLALPSCFSCAGSLSSLHPCHSWSSAQPSYSCAFPQRIFQASAYPHSQISACARLSLVCPQVQSSALPLCFVMRGLTSITILRRLRCQPTFNWIWPSYSSGGKWKWTGIAKVFFLIFSAVASMSCSHNFFSGVSCFSQSKFTMYPASAWCSSSDLCSYFLCAPSFRLTGTPGSCSLNYLTLLFDSQFFHYWPVLVLKFLCVKHLCVFSFPYQILTSAPIDWSSCLWETFPNEHETVVIWRFHICNA